MNSPFEIWLNTSTGTRLALLDQVQKVSYVLSANQIGAWSLTLPDVLDPSLFATDNLVEIWYTPEDGPPSLETIGFIRRKVRYDDVNGSGFVELSGPDAMYLLDSRIVAYAAGTAQASKTDYADDMIKDIVRENLGGSAVAARDLSAYLSVEADRGEGVSLSKGFSWRNVLLTAQEIAAASYEESGVPLYFFLQPVWDGNNFTMVFRTRVGQPGADRTYGSGAPVVFSRAFSNLLNPVFVEDYTDERNYIYGCGQGYRDDRDIQELGNTSRIQISPWNRREYSLNTSGYETSTGSLDRVRAELSRRAPKAQFTASLLSVPGTRYGIDWRWGDKVIAIYQETQIEAVAERVQVEMDESGHVVVSTRVMADL